MEAGRAVMRGFVTPDRTTLIASTHRTHAVAEKIVPGDGQAPEAEVYAAMETAAKRLITADYQRAAVDAGSVISASLFGALAAAAVLPFPRQSVRGRDQRRRAAASTQASVPSRPARRAMRLRPRRRRGGRQGPGARPG